MVFIVVFILRCAFLLVVCLFVSRSDEAARPPPIRVVKGCFPFNQSCDVGKRNPSKRFPAKVELPQSQTSAPPKTRCKVAQQEERRLCAAALHRNGLWKLLRFVDYNRPVERPGSAAGNLVKRP